MIILELFVGPELVHCFKTNSDAQDTLVHLSSQLGARIYNLLKGLLFDVKFSIVRELLEDGILDNGQRICKAIKDVAQKMKTSKFLQDMLDEDKRNGERPSTGEISLFGQSSS
jgi:predicted transcriptional regulator YheO